MREIALGSPYERAIAGDATTQGLAQLFQDAGATPDFTALENQQQDREFHLWQAEERRSVNNSLLP